MTDTQCTAYHVRCAICLRIVSKAKPFDPEYHAGKWICDQCAKVAWVLPILEGFTLVEDPEGFVYEEARKIADTYVCPVCHGQLALHQLDSDRKDSFGYNYWIVFCPEHGNIEQIGRVSVNTVSIQLEKAHYDFDKVIANLPDLWGSLAKKKKSVEQNLKELGF